jgi:hypothetical protein
VVILFERRKHELFVHSRLLHVAQVAEQSESAELSLAGQTFPRLALIRTRGKRNPPRSGSLD